MGKWKQLYLNTNKKKSINPTIKDKKERTRIMHLISVCLPRSNKTNFLLRHLVLKGIPKEKIPQKYLVLWQYQNRNINSVLGCFAGLCSFGSTDPTLKNPLSLLILIFYIVQHKYYFS